MNDETPTDAPVALSDLMTLQDYGTETKQIGPRVRPGLWEDFKAYTEAKHGKQGKTSEELQLAMIKHLKTDGVPEEEIEDEGEPDTEERLDVINAKLDSVLVAVNQ